MPYVHANVKVKYGQLPASYEAMVTIRRVMEQNGWKLVGAWSTVIGDIHEVHDMWEVEDANAVPAGFAAAYEDSESVQASAQLATIADREVLSLVAKTSTAPDLRHVPPPSPRRWRAGHAGGPQRRRQPARSARRAPVPPMLARAARPPRRPGRRQAPLRLRTSHCAW